MFDESFFFRVLVSALLTASALSWLRWGLRPEQFGGPPADLPKIPPLQAETVQANDTFMVAPVEPRRWPPLAVFAVLFWVATSFLNRVAFDTRALWQSKSPTPVVESVDKNADEKSQGPAAFSEDAILGTVLQGCIVFVGLGLLLFLTGRLRPDDVGISAENGIEQFAWGQQAFIAAILPTFLVILATSWLRSRDTEHEFLQMVRNAPEQVPLLLMFFAVAVVAPLAEELMFRVTLQGWLTDQWQARGAMITTAVIFSFVHGWRDGIALLPLSLILGYLYHVRRSYLAVVTTHAMFNASQLAMALLGAMSANEVSQ